MTETKKLKKENKKEKKGGSVKKRNNISDEIRQLKSECEERREELFRLKMDLRRGKLKDTNSLKKARKEIARILTKISRKKILLRLEKKGENRA